MELAEYHSQAHLLDLSFPRRRESRFIFLRISLDTRFRGYDGLRRSSRSNVFSKESTKDPKVSEIYFSELRALRVLRGEYTITEFHSSQFPQHRPAGRAVGTGEFHRRAEKLVATRRHFGQIDAFEQNHAVIEEGAMHRHLLIGPRGR